MCNACGFHCCASDCFEACGCDHCFEEACWGLDPESDDTYGDDYERSGRFRCVAITDTAGSGS